MKLRYSRTSPYVRKVLVAAHELGCFDRLELVAVDPWSPAADLGSDNPLMQVPALEPGDGSMLVGSTSIMMFLARGADEHRTVPGLPAVDVQRRLYWQHLERIEGGIDAAVLRVIEARLRPPELRWPEWDRRQKVKVDAVLDYLDGLVPAPDAEFCPADRPLDFRFVAAACLLGYLDFRFGGEDWRADRPKLARWHDVVAARPSLEATRPDG